MRFELSTAALLTERKCALKQKLFSLPACLRVSQLPLSGNMGQSVRALLYTIAIFYYFDAIFYVDTYIIQEYTRIWNSKMLHFKELFRDDMT